MQNEKELSQTSNATTNGTATRSQITGSTQIAEARALLRGDDYLRPNQSEPYRKGKQIEGYLGHISGDMEQELFQRTKRTDPGIF